jgi:hypothetical protein
VQNGISRVLHQEALPNRTVGERRDINILTESWNGLEGLAIVFFKNWIVLKVPSSCRNQDQLFSEGRDARGDHWRLRVHERPG